MADRTVRAVFEARVTGAIQGMKNLSKGVAGAGKDVDGLTKDLKTLDAAKVKPEVDVKIDEAKKRLKDLTLQLTDLKGMEATPEVTTKIADTQAAIKEVRADLKALNNSKTEVRIDASIKDAQKRLSEVTKALGELRTQEASPEVDVQIAAAQRSLRAVKAEIRDLNGAKAQIVVKADTAGAEKAVRGLGASGDDAGDEIGDGMVSGILSALQSIPIAGAVIGVGAAIAGGLILGIQQGLSIEVERDLFSARTGLDEETSARFGRSAGEAYASAWGDSVEANLDTARAALQFGLIDADAQDAEIEQVIASLSGLSEVMGTDIPATARAAGIMIRTGLVANADQAFDTLVSGYQNGADASEDLLDTMTEYPALFAKLGLSGDEATGLIVQGMKAGARNSDLAADALKEFQIRATDGSKLSAEGFEALGLSAEGMTAKIAAGGEGAKQGLDQVLDGLRAMTDPVERNAAGVALFGTKWEDLGDAMLALDVTTAVEALGSVEGSAGSAARALEKMSDNTSTKIEEARRNVEVAMDGIKGALAEAFGDEIGGASEWVAANRAPLMQFFLDVINGALDMGVAFAEFGASSLGVIADLADGMANVMQYIPGMGDAADSLRGVADGARDGADGIREDIPAALNEVRGKVNTWAAPELLKARIHDATMAMTADMDEFSAAVDASGGTVTINGDKLNAEQALDAMVAAIDGEDGTVTINGDKVPAADALKTVMAQIGRSKENVTIGGDTGPAEGKLSTVKGKVSRTEASMTINANTGSAERALANLSRDRFAYLNIKVRGGTQLAGAHEGGWTGQVMPGLNGGGRVPGSDPGYDNVLWPLNSGGRTLQQPLAGGEYVVNSTDSAYWAPLLDWMNNGGRPSATRTQVAAPSAGPQRIEGTLDIGNGIVGVVRGVLHQEAVAARGGSSMAGADL